MPSYSLVFKAVHQQSPHAFVPSFLIPSQLPEYSSNTILDHQSNLTENTFYNFPIGTYFLKSPWIRYITRED